MAHILMDGLMLVLAGVCQGLVVYFGYFGYNTKELRLSGSPSFDDCV